MLGAPDELLKSMEYPFLSLQGENGAMDALDMASDLARKISPSQTKTQGKSPKELSNSEWLMLFGTLVDKEAREALLLTKKATQEDIYVLLWFASRLANTATTMICGRTIQGKAPATKLLKAWHAAWTILGSHHVKRKNDKKQAKQQSIIEAMKKQEALKEKPKSISFAEAVSYTHLTLPTILLV